MARKKDEPSARPRRRPFAGEKAADAKIFRADAKPTTAKAKTQSAIRASARMSAASGTTAHEPGGDYKIGYKKPPEHSRFKPGRSGNPKGRRRGARNLKTILEEALQASVPISHGGKTKRIRLIEAIGAQLARKSAGGDNQSIKLVLDVIDRLGLFAEPENVADGKDELPEEDRHLLERLQGWARKGRGPATG